MESQATSITGKTSTRIVEKANSCSCTSGVRTPCKKMRREQCGGELDPTIDEKAGPRLAGLCVVHHAQTHTAAMTTQQSTYEENASAIL